LLLFYTFVSILLLNAKIQMPRSLNSVQLIGNLTRDPELRYTKSGRPVCDVGLATSRQWKTENGERKEETDFHRIVVWGKLGEICSQYLRKGQKAYFSGRLSTRKWTAQDGTERQTTEIIATDMIMLSGGRIQEGVQAKTPQAAVKADLAAEEGEAATDQADHKAFDVDPDEIPF
jgi:single-strand DNA-binding protein